MSNPKPWKNHLPSPHDHLHDSSTLMGPPAGPLDPDDDGSGGGGRDSQSPPSSLPHQHRQQRKGGGTKAWMVVESGGWSGIEEFGKHAIMRRAGLPARDLRILDPMLSYPSTILGRERAIVVKLEHIKAIITANEVLVLNSKDPLVDSFLRELKLRIAGSPKSATEQAQENDQLHTDTVDTQLYQLLSENDESTHSTRQLLDNPIPDVKDASTSPSTKSDVPKVEAPKTLPFEFRVLELCLECACRCLETETSTLEQEAYPALDELTSQISTLNLERVRQIKSRLVAISGRVQKVRDELEHLLDDDMDMAEMYLTDKLNRQQLEETDSRGDTDDDLTDLNDECEESSMKKSRGSSENLSFSPNIEELEMLLEAYFVQTEGILNKLSALREYVDDTEDYINIMLDDKQNQLLQMGVILSTATLLISAGIAVVGMFGTNIHISIYDAQPINFWETTFGCLVSCIILFISAITWGKRKGLLS